MSTINITSASTPANTPKVIPRRPRIIPHEDSLGPIGRAKRASQEDLRASSPDTASSPRSNLPIFLPPIVKSEESQSQVHNSCHFEEEAGWICKGADSKHNVGLRAVDELDLPHEHSKLPCHKHHHARLEAVPVKVIYAGPGGNQKRFELPTNLLEAKSRYFQKLFENDPIADNILFEDMDPYAMEMCAGWIISSKVEVPTTFHALTHCYALFVIGERLEMEGLCNDTIDAIRQYYRDTDQTPSPFRLDYAYTCSQPDSMLRLFTAAAVSNRLDETGDVSDSMKHLLSKHKDIAQDLETERFAKTRSTYDPRRVRNCNYHDHKHTPCCPEDEARPQLDGA